MSGFDVVALILNGSLILGLTLGLIVGALELAEGWLRAARGGQPPDAAAAHDVGSTQIAPLHGVTLTETYLHIHDEVLRVRDLRFVKLYDHALRVVDGNGCSHQVCRFTAPASPKVVALAEALQAIVDPERATSPTLRLSVRAQRTSRCPYCHDDLLDPEVECGQCGTGHHAECFRAHGDCAILACGRGRRRRAS